MLKDVDLFIKSSLAIISLKEPCTLEMLGKSLLFLISLIEGLRT